jgi:hypothetical protein
MNQQATRRTYRHSLYQATHQPPTPRLPHHPANLRAPLTLPKHPQYPAVPRPKERNPCNRLANSESEAKTTAFRYYPTFQLNLPSVTSCRTRSLLQSFRILAARVPVLARVQVGSHYPLSVDRIIVRQGLELELRHGPGHHIEILEILFE